jgi:hypothetical protein
MGLIDHVTLDKRSTLTSYDSNVESTAPKTVGLPITLEVICLTKRYLNSILHYPYLESNQKLNFTRVVL